MKFIKSYIAGSYIIEQEKKEDSRGFFARYFCQKEFSSEGLETNFVQINNSLSVKKGTLRGLHYQIGSHAEVKVVRCIKGAVLDLIMDLRPNSPTFLKSFSVELSSEARNMFYVPAGCAHGLFSLLDNTEVIYQASNYYHPDAERGLRFDDNVFALKLPFDPVDVTDKDLSWKRYDPSYHDMNSSYK
jgi:dTDP-4-dehydrorhamnose 3,5-epimerase